MRSAGNFSPEWGYLASAPSFMRTARVVIAATAVGAVAGAAVVLSLTDRPAIDGEQSLVAAHAIVTSVQAATATAVPLAAAPATAAPTAAIQSPVNLPPAALVRTPAPAANSAAVNASTAEPATAPPPNSSSGVTALSEAPPAGDAAPSDLPDGTTLAPEAPVPPKKPSKRSGAANARNQFFQPPIPGVGALRRMFSAHTGTSYYPDR